MAPPRTAREPSIDETEEYDQFIEKLRAFHDQRGTNFDPTPRVGSRRVDLLRLYKRVVSDGGYDIVSNTKLHKLAWRSLSQDFHLGTANLPLLAFGLKTAYYKNLAAYEIVDIHKKIPPPKEILEDVTAAGGDLLNRTVENFTRSQGREERNTNAPDQEGSDDDSQRTPKEDRMEIDEPNTSGRRGLRQAPPQRVLFQPDTSSSRMIRQPSANLHISPTPPTNPYAGVNGYSHQYAQQGLSQSLASYEPKPQLPLTLRPVTTPANNPEAFRALQAQSREANQPRHGRNPKSMMLPGTGFTGPNIYTRTLLALQSGIPEEQEYALHHLVKISHERGDKYRFDQFVGLAEALVEKILEISSLFSRVEWKIVYDYSASSASSDTLDGLSGTLDILERINTFKPIRIQDSMQTLQFSQRLALIVEAALVVRNMTMLEENAEYLSRNAVFKDALTILVNLPHDPKFVEVKQYGFEMAEQMTRYYHAISDDPLLKSLKGAINSADRAIVLASLRAVSRMGTQLEHVAPLQDISPHILNHIAEWLLVEDQELVGACLVFLYRFTAVVDNIDSLFENTDPETMTKLIVRTLMYGARTIEERRPPSPVKPINVPKPPLTADGEVPIPRIPTDLVEALLTYDEPERSSQWLRTCFEEDPAGEITQIALWQAYQIPFAPYGAQRPLLPAKDFITNVSTTFSHASAQVINGPTLRFVIKGIRPRAAPVDPRGRAYMRCQWHLDKDDVECGEFAQAAKQMWEHIVTTHLSLVKGADGLYHFSHKSSQLYSCRWAGCQRFTTASDAVSPFAVGMHVKTHLPDTSSMAYQRSKHNVSSAQSETQFAESQTSAKSISTSLANALGGGMVVNGLGGPTPPATPSVLSDNEPQPAASALKPQIPTSTWPLYNTLTDERNDAAGLPLTAALILRNLARGIPRTDAAVREEAKLAARAHKGRNSFNHGQVLPIVIDTTVAGLQGDGIAVGSSLVAPKEELTGGDVLLWRVFSPLRSQLFYVMAHNQPLREYLATVAKAISRGGMSGIMPNEME